jgi:hypothetical protein
MLSEAKHLWTSFDGDHDERSEILRIAQDDKPLSFRNDGHKIAHWFSPGD